MRRVRWDILAPCLVVAAASCWGMIGFFSAGLSDAGLAPLQIAEVRCVIAAAALLLVCLALGREHLRIRLRDIWLFLGTGVCSIAFFNICYFACIELSTLSVACTLLYTSPCFIVLMSCLLFREEFTPRKAASILFAFTGCTFITGIISEAPGLSISAQALAFGLCSGFCYALYSIIGRYILRRYDWLTTITYTFLFAALALLPFCAPVELAHKLINGRAALLNALLLGLLSTMLPFILYTNGLKHMDTGKAALLTFVEPMVATFISAAILKEDFSANNAIGAALIVLSIVVLNSPVPHFGKNRGGKGA